MSIIWLQRLNSWPMPLLLLFIQLSVIHLHAQEPPISWIENFDLEDGMEEDSDATSWVAIDGKVQNNRLVFNNTHGYWISEPIRLLGQEVDINILFGSEGTPKSEDKLLFTYEIDGTQHSGTASGVLSEGKMSFVAGGKYLTLQIEAQTGGIYYLDEIRIEGREIEQEFQPLEPQAPGPIVNSFPWYEDFDLPDHTQIDRGATGWTSNGGEIIGQRFEIQNKTAYWESSPITTAGNTFTVETIFGSLGDVDKQDFVRIIYMVDGVAHTTEKTGPLYEGAEILTGKGELLQIKVEASTSAIYYLSSIQVKNHKSVPDSSPPAPAPTSTPVPPNDPSISVQPLVAQELPWIVHFNKDEQNYHTFPYAWMANQGITQQDQFIFTKKGIWKSAPIEIQGKAQLDLQLDFTGSPSLQDQLIIIYDVDGEKSYSVKQGAFETKNESRIISGNKLIISIESTSSQARYSINKVEVHSETVDENEPVPSDCNVARGRVKNIQENGNWRIVTDIGTNLRGIGGWWHGVFEDRYDNEDPDMYYTEEWWEAMWENGLNASRAICHDPWRRSEYGEGNGYNFNNPTQRDAFIEKMDKVVDLARKYHMYLVINYHEVGKVDMDMCKEFWNVVAPRYKDEPHVIYEIMNEVEGARDWKTTDSRNVEEMYHFVRSLAPDTYLMLCSFSNMGPDWTYDYDQSMLAVAKSLQNIDWKNSGIAFHSYWGNNMARYVEELIKEFPGVNTEINLPLNYVTKDPYDDQIRNKPLAPGEEWNQETMERLNVGWMTWEHDTWREFRHNYLAGPNENLTNPGKPGLLYQAREENWVWDFDKDLYDCNETIIHRRKAPTITLFPNPVPSSFSEFNVELPKNWDGATLRLYNMQSELLQMKKSDHELISLSKPSPGIYHLVITHEGKRHVVKVSIQ